MISIEGLKALGADADSGLSRCVGNEALYLKLVGMGLGDAKFEELGTAINAGDLERTFELCHALKGVIGNLSLTPLYQALCEMTEKLRAQEAADYAAMYSEIISICSKFLDS